MNSNSTFFGQSGHIIVDSETVSIEPDKIRAARRGIEQPFSFYEVLNDTLAAEATLSEMAPQWLMDELASEGVAIYQLNGEWVLGPLDC